MDELLELDELSVLLDSVELEALMVLDEMVLELTVLEDELSVDALSVLLESVLLDTLDDDDESVLSEEMSDTSLCVLGDDVLLRVLLGDDADCEDVDVDDGLEDGDDDCVLISDSAEIDDMVLTDDD